MSKAHTLVELVVALALVAVLVLAVYSGVGLFREAYHHNHAAWLSLQTIRLAEILLERDLCQLGYLMPADLSLRVWDKNLLLAGVPVTSRHPGLSLGVKPPPYYALVRACEGRRLELDSLDLDGDGRTDFVAGLGLISDGGAYLIERVEAGGAVVWLNRSSEGGVTSGDRVVPAVHYEQRGAQLWRDDQLALENVSGFEVEQVDCRLKLRLVAGDSESQRSCEYEYPLP